MTELQTILLTSAISIFVAVVTSWITNKFAFKNDIQKNTYHKREELYVKLSKEIDKLLMDRKLVFDLQFTKDFIGYKSEVKLYASNSVVEAYRKIVIVIARIRREYGNFKDNNDPTKQFENYYIEMDSNTRDEYEGTYITEDMICDFELKCSTYEEENILELSEVQKLVNTLNKKMRRDMGSN